MHEGVLEAGAFASHKADGFGDVVFSHGRMEVGGGFVLGFELAAAPFHAEAVGQTAKHARDPEAIGAADSATIFIERNVEPLMESTFNSPGLPVGLQPFSGAEGLW